MLTVALFVFAAVRAAIGVAPFVAVQALVPVFGFPEAEVTGSAVAFARLFGIRDVGLGVTIVWAATHPDLILPVIVFNGATDLCDLAALLWGASRRPDLKRPLGLCALAASSGLLAWLVIGTLYVVGHTSAPGGTP